MNTAMRKQYTSPRPTTGRRGGRVQKGHRNLGRASATVCNQERCTAPSVTLRDTHHGVIAEVGTQPHFLYVILHRSNLPFSTVSRGV